MTPRPERRLTSLTPMSSRLPCECVGGPHGGYTCEECR